mmetsp:Transcript_36202/g.55595  ORF Transcript_36202/g.55595 Transcript_36202/m.55595 type:complete len:202 (-) Transcript_36202:131-736(-)
MPKSINRPHYQRKNSLAAFGQAHFSEKPVVLSTHPRKVSFEDADNTTTQNHQEEKQQQQQKTIAPKRSLSIGKLRRRTTSLCLVALAGGTSSSHDAMMQETNNDSASNNNDIWGHFVDVIPEDASLSRPILRSCSLEEKSSSSPYAFMPYSLKSEARMRFQEPRRWRRIENMKKLATKAQFFQRPATATAGVERAFSKLHV